MSETHQTEQIILEAAEFISNPEILEYAPNVLLLGMIIIVCVEMIIKSLANAVISIYKIPKEPLEFSFGLLNCILLVVLIATGITCNSVVFKNIYEPDNHNNIETFINLVTGCITSSAIVAFINILIKHHKEQEDKFSSELPILKILLVMLSPLIYTEITYLCAKYICQIYNEYILVILEMFQSTDNVFQFQIVILTVLIGVKKLYKNIASIIPKSSEDNQDDLE